MKKIESIEEFLSTLPTYSLKSGNVKLDEDSLCPCGEGIKFKYCCINEWKEAFDSHEESSTNPTLKSKNYLKPRKYKDIPSFKLYEKSLGKKNVAFCLAKKSTVPCSNKGIRYAHTLAESSVLKVLSEGKKNVFTFNRYLNFPSDDIDDYLVPMKTKEASIVNTFCSEHDKALFKEIENGNSYRNDALQNLQLALNAAALNVYGITLQIMLLQKFLKEERTYWLYKSLHTDYDFYIKELKSSVDYTNRLVSDIENKELSSLFTFSLELKYTKLPFVFCEGCKVNVNGNDILVFINVFPSESGTWITVSAYEEGKIFIENLRRYKNDSKIDEILKIIISEISRQGSNIYFKEEYVESLTVEEKAILYYFFTLNGARKIAEDIENKYFNNYSSEDKKAFYFNTLIKK